MTNYKNGMMELTLMNVSGDYAYFKMNNSILKHCSFIVAFKPVFFENTVTWANGYYTLTHKQAIELFKEKIKSRF